MSNAKDEVLRYLESQEANFSKERNLLGGIWNGPGYHTKLPNGGYYHSTRSSIYYALALLDSGAAKYLERAPKVIRAVLKSQVTNPYDPAFGIWPWLDEEPVSEMAPPDWNWADFIGAALCHMLREHSDQLDTELKADISTALERAAWSIFRRNVQPGYTNIALMGAAVTGCAGEILNIPFLVGYARARLKGFLDYGILNEFNSPTYTFVALGEVERILQLVKDHELRQYAEKLRHFVWEEIATHFHVATGQLGGTQSRAYHEYLTAGTLKVLSETTGLDFRPAHGDNTPAAGEYDSLRHLSCPADLLKYFKSFEGAKREKVKVCAKRDNPQKNFVSTLFMTPELVLGSINRNAFWAQARPLLGYWPSSTDIPAMFRLRGLKNGKDFSSLGVRMAQKENKVLCFFNLLTDRGDHHIHLDFPADRIYRFTKLSARFDLAAPDAKVSELADGRFELLSGQYRAIIHTMPGRFDGHTVKWQCGTAGDRAYVEAVFYEGPEIAVKFDEKLAIDAGCAVEVIRRDQVPDANRPALRTDKDLHLTWGDIHLDSPRLAYSHE